MEIEAKRAEIEQIKVTLEEKRAIKDAAELPEKEALDKIKAEEDRLKQLREEEEKLEREKEALVSYLSFFSGVQGMMPHIFPEMSLKIPVINHHSYFDRKFLINLIQTKMVN